MRDLKRGELIVEVPREAIMSRTSARRSPEIGHLLRRLPGHLALAIHVLFESKVLGPASKFSPYLALLPKSEPTATCCFGSGRPLTPAEERALCRVEDALFGVCPSLADVARQRQELWDTFTALDEGLFAPRRHLFPATAFSRANFSWAYAIVSSRSFAIRMSDGDGFTLTDRDELPRDSGSSFNLLVPFADLFNHGLPAGCGEAGEGEGGQVDLARCAGGIWFNSSHLSTTPYWYDDSRRVFRVFADADYAKGQEVTICYGKKGSRDLLSRYGFQLPPGANAFDSLEVSAAALAPLLGEGDVGIVPPHSPPHADHHEDVELAGIKHALLRVYGLHDHAGVSANPDVAAVADHHAVTATFKVSTRGTVSPNLLAALRIRSLTRDDLRALLPTDNTGAESAAATDTDIAGRFADLVAALEANAWYATQSDRFDRPLTLMNEASVRSRVALQCELALRNLQDAGNGGGGGGDNNENAMEEKGAEEREETGGGTGDRGTEGGGHTEDRRRHLKMLEAQVEQWFSHMSVLLRSCVLDSFRRLETTSLSAVQAQPQLFDPAAVRAWETEMEAYQKKWEGWWEGRMAAAIRPKQ
eukprot:g800.t1